MPGEHTESGFFQYAAKHMLIAVAAAVGGIAVLVIGLGFFDQPATEDGSAPALHQDALAASDAAPGTRNAQALNSVKQTMGGAARDGAHTREAAPTHATPAPETHPSSAQRPAAPSGGAPHGDPPAAAPDASAQAPQYAPPAGGAHAPQAPAASPPAPAHEPAPAEAAHDHAEAPQVSFPAVGMAFVDAVIAPLHTELYERWYGWRPNDLIRVTDNVNNFQLGVLEVTRRTSVALAERLSRTGSTAAFDKNLENAMNWLMIKADRYWFPSAESKYKASLEGMRSYFHKLEKGEANFYTRTDNLIPLLAAYEDLLGSCDENLVKTTEDDGRPVSFFAADDYFFYAQGVASAMHTILQAVQVDFNIMVSREGGLEVLHHAIESLHHATQIDPILILNSDLDSLLANHRLNMAAPISHARFYLGVLKTALST